MKSSNLAIVGIVVIAAVITLTKIKKRSGSEQENALGAGATTEAVPITEQASSNKHSTSTKSKNVMQIVDRLEMMLQKGELKDPQFESNVESIMEKLTAEDVQDALAAALTMTDADMQQLLASSALSKWAEIDGLKAMSYIEELPADSPFKSYGKIAVANRWVETDIDGIWDWYKNRTDYANGEDVIVHKMFDKIASQDIDVAFTRMNELTGAAKLLAIRGVAQSSLHDASKRKQIEAMVEALPVEERKAFAQSFSAVDAQATGEQRLPEAPPN